MGMENTAESLSEQISKAMTSPVSVSADGVSVSAPSISEQIKAAEFLAANRSMSQKRRGMRMQRIIPDGTL